MPESDLIIAIGVLIFFRSHTLADRSSDPLTILSPDAKAAEVTELSLKENIHKFSYGSHVQGKVRCYCRRSIPEIAFQERFTRPKALLLRTVTGRKTNSLEDNQ